MYKTEALQYSKRTLHLISDSTTKKLTLVTLIYLDVKHSFIFQTQKEKTDWIRNQFHLSLLDIQPLKMGLNSLILKQDKCYVVVMWFLLRTSLKLTLLVVLKKVVSFSLTIYSSIHIMILRTLSLHMKMLQFLFMKKLHYFYEIEGHLADLVHLQVIGCWRHCWKCI